MKSYEEMASSLLQRRDAYYNKRKKRMKYSLTVAGSCCLILLVCFGLWHGFKPDAEISKTANIELNINEKDTANLTVTDANMDLAKVDAEIETVKLDDIVDRFEFLKELEVPKEYQNIESYNVFVKNPATNIYDQLHDYVFVYQKDKNHRITLTFSELEKPLRDAYFDDNAKESKIDNTPLTIFKWDDAYLTTFKYNNIFFDIETKGITENELITLLQSIIK